MIRLIHQILTVELLHLAVKCLPDDDLRKSKLVSDIYDFCAVFQNQKNKKGGQLPS